MYVCMYVCQVYRYAHTSGCIWGRKLGHGGNVPEARIDIQTRHHHPRLSPFSSPPSPSLALPPPSHLSTRPHRGQTPVCLFFPSAVYLAVRRVNGPTGMSSAMRAESPLARDRIFPPREHLPPLLPRSY